MRGNHNELFTLAVTLIRNATEELREGGRISIETSHTVDQVVMRVRTEGTRRSNDGPERMGEGLWTRDWTCAAPS